jgi:hypothetical protein
MLSANRRGEDAAEIVACYVGVSDRETVNDMLADFDC